MGRKAVLTEIVRVWVRVRFRIGVGVVGSNSRVHCWSGGGRWTRRKTKPRGRTERVVDVRHNLQARQGCQRTLSYKLDRDVPSHSHSPSLSPSPPPPFSFRSAAISFRRSSGCAQGDEALPLLLLVAGVLGALSSASLASRCCGEVDIVDDERGGSGRKGNDLRRQGWVYRCPMLELEKLRCRSEKERTESGAGIESSESRRRVRAGLLTLLS